MLNENIKALRKSKGLSQQELAVKLNVVRQTVSKWEQGESIPDIVNCDALARLYDVELSDLIHHDPERTKMGIAPKGKHIFGTVRVGERGQIVLPKAARDVFQIRPGDVLVVLGDESQEHPGIALMKESFFLGITKMIRTALQIAQPPEEKEGE